MSNDFNILPIQNAADTPVTSAIYSNSLTSVGGAGSGTITGTTACYPYSGYTTLYYPQPQYVSYEIQLRKLENGWVLLKGGKEYILKNPEDVVKYMKENK